MPGSLPNNCKSCAAPFTGMPIEVTLGGDRPSLYCPLCGALVGHYESDRVFHDAETGAYRLWVDNSSDSDIEHQETWGRMAVRIRCVPLDIHACFFDRLFVFRADGLESVREPGHFSPLRPDREHLIRKWSVSSATPSYRAYNVTTSTGWTVSIALACLEVTELAGELGAALFIWPNFVAPDWRRYYVAFYPPSVPKALGTGGLESAWTRNRQATQGPQFEPVPIDGLPGAQILEVPDRIVLQWTVDGIEYVNAWRTDVDEPDVPHLQDSDPVRAERINVGFDFGTTNTAAAVFYALPDEKRQVTHSAKPLPIA